ncbi:acyltransferase [Aeromicrobium sp. NPDC092404]|uniref:acyltransferase family protein n=1 Tax=Aeromicrobium sp. NPDC092404 TaxID=3154976 RepID=UPI0034157680
MTAGTPPTAPTKAPSFPGLDTIRAVAAIWVVVTHVAFWTGSYGSGLLGALAQRLEAGVAVFFVLSGFLLSYPWLRQLRIGSTRDSVGRYALKRVLRILPVYWVAVVAALVLVPQNDDTSLPRAVDAFLMIDMYRDGLLLEGLTQMWSLATEVAFYVSLPVLMALLVGAVARGRWRPVRMLAALAGVAVGSLVWVAVAADFLTSWGGWVNQALPGYLGWFAIGIGFAVLDVDRRNAAPGHELALTRWCRTAASAPWTCWIVAGALLFVASTPLLGPVLLVERTPTQLVCRAILFGLVAAIVVLPSIFGRPSTTYARVLANPFLRHLGHISYSLFCCHVIVIAVLFDRLDLTQFAENMWFVLGLVLVVSLVVSELLYRVVELPCMRLKDLGRRRPTAATAETPASARS